MAADTGPYMTGYALSVLCLYSICREESTRLTNLYHVNSPVRALGKMTYFLKSAWHIQPPLVFGYAHAVFFKTVLN